MTAMKHSSASHATSGSAQPVHQRAFAQAQTQIQKPSGNDSARPRVVLLSLASDFGCQIQLSNFPQLLETLGSIDLRYWQLLMTAPLPTDFDLAIIEGAITTSEHVELLQQVRKTACTVITIGACAGTGGVPALARGKVEESAQTTYGDAAGTVAADCLNPHPVSSVITVDYHIPGCPINPEEFSQVLQGALLGVQERAHREPLCGHCKIIEAPCFYRMQAMGLSPTDTPCLGLVTQTGCGALCISRGRPCTGCRGIAEDANLDSARRFVRQMGRSVEEFDAALEVYNSVKPDTKLNTKLNRSKESEQ